MKTEIRNDLEKRFKLMVIKILSELRRRLEEHSEKLSRDRKHTHTPTHTHTYIKNQSRLKNKIIIKSKNNRGSQQRII